jgi:AbiJ N-terminal domain 4
MPIIDLYSKRKKRIEKGNQPEIYQYDELPLTFRQQVVYIWRDAIGVYQNPEPYHTIGMPFVNRVWYRINNLLARELGIDLGSGFLSNSFEDCKAFFLDKDTSIENLLDLIELTFIFIDELIRKELAKPPGHCELNVSQQPDDAISELNHRFREHEIGYQFEGGQIIRVDSKFIHAEVIVPALGLLSAPSFAGPEQEFRSAHEHYRRQEYKDAIVDALFF